MSVLSVFESNRPAAEASVAELGYEELQLTPPTQAEVVSTYLEYKQTGGRPIKVWERKLQRLEASGQLPALIAEAAATADSDS